MTDTASTEVLNYVHVPGLDPDPAQFSVWHWLLTDEMVRFGFMIFLVVFLGGASFRRIYVHLTTRDMSPAKRGRTLMALQPWQRRNAKDFPQQARPLTQRERDFRFRALRRERDGRAP